MPGRLASPRFRRRLGWTVGAATIVTGVTAGAIAIGNTGHSNETPLYDRPAWVWKEPPRMNLTAADRRELFETATQFIKTAVARKHLDSAWDMLGPEMKAGQTRKSWDTGFNNVIPFPAVGIATWDILYAYKDDVAIDLGVIGDPKSDWAGKTFTIELKRYKSRPHDWLVASWVPKGIGGGGQIRSVASQPPLPAPKAQLNKAFLFFPFAIVGALLIGLVLWAVRSSVRHRRAARRYASALGYGSTTKPS